MMAAISWTDQPGHALDAHVLFKALSNHFLQDEMTSAAKSFTHAKPERLIDM